jgi:hypothetical protein
MITLILIVIAIEAVTELIFRAGPLQPAREWLIDHTSWARAGLADEHLLECKYCVSVWVALFFALGYLFFLESQAFLCFLYAVSFHRLANLFHLPLSYLRDKQLNLRIERNKRG